MNDGDKIRFSQIMTGLAEDCSAEISKNGLKMRFDILKRFSIEQVERAILKVMSENVYNKMPTTGTILQAIEGTKEDRAEFQCSQVIKAIRQTGRSQTPNFLDRITSTIVNDHYGWVNICNKTESELPFFERDFKNKYKSFESIESTTKKTLNAPEDIKGLIGNIGRRIE